MEHSRAQVRGPAEQPTASMVQRVTLWVVGAVALVAVVGAPAAASWHGLVGFGRRELGLTGGWEYLVPFALDGAALYAAVLAVRAVLAGDSAIWPRVLTCLYALAAAGFNAHAAATEVAALFYAGMSISAVVLWDTTLRALRRDQLRELGVVQGVSARFRPLRWLLAPTETGQAWRAAVLEDIVDPRAALRVVRGERVDLDDPDSRPPGGGGGGVPAIGDWGPTPLGSGPRLELTVGTKADAIRAAFDAIGRRDVPAALAWLAERGVSVDRSYAYTVSWRPPLRPAAGGAR